MIGSRWAILGVLSVAAAATAAELPEFYHSVDRVVWVVEDLDRTAQELRRVGMTNFTAPEEAAVEGEYRGKPATGSIRWMSGRFADVAVHWIEPLEAGNAFADFRDRHGSGVFALVHRAPSALAFDDEIGRLRALGVGVLQRGTIETSAGEIRWVFFDTEPDGKYVVGLIHFPGGEEGPLAVAPENPSGRTVVQFAFAVKQLEPVSEYWAHLGFPPMKFTHGKLRDLRYRGKPGEFDMRLGWQRHGKVPYEWIESLKGPDIYLDHMKVHGEGFQHFAFRVEDMDADIGWWAERGYEVTMSGAWGEEGRPGSGRFAYLDAERLGGVAIELLWSYRPDEK